MIRRLVLPLLCVLLSACVGNNQRTISAPPPTGAVQQSSVLAGSNSSSELPIPQLVGRVNDYAEILTPKERADLDAQLAAYERETMHQIAVLTVQSLHAETIEAFSFRVANAWALGRKNLDNGVLVVVAPNDRRARIELGDGMSQFVSDSAAQKIMDESMVPQFRAGHFGRGIELGVQQLMEVCRAYKVQP
jgi:uncharacterized protein